VSASVSGDVVALRWVMKAIDIALIATLVVLLAILAARFFFPASMPF
jgi:hypothetical protein